MAACALGVLGIEDNARYATVRAVDGLVILGVLLTASGHAKLTDFGAARPMAEHPAAAAAIRAARNVIMELRDGDWRAKKAADDAAAAGGAPPAAAADDDDSWEAVAAGGGGWGDEAAEAMAAGARPRLTHAKLLKVGVVARYWPEDWARMSPRLRQQTLAEGLEFVCADEPPHTEAPPQSIAGYTPKKPGSARRAPLA